MYKTVAPGAVGHGLTFKDAAEGAAKAGFEGYWFGPEDDWNVPAGETKELLQKTYLKAAGFGLPVQFRQDAAAFEADLANLGKYAQYAVEIGALRCATWILPRSDTLTFNENYELHRSRLKKVCEIFNEYGITLGLEFVGPLTARQGAKYTFIHNLDQMLSLCADIGTGNCGLLLDIWHWDLAGQTFTDFEKFGNDQVALVHINDAPAGIPPDEQADTARRLPGETGVLRIAEFFGGLKKIGYDGPVLAEPFVPALAEMSYDNALKTVMDSFNRVWPE